MAIKRKIYKHARKSSLMDVTVKFNREKIDFNLFDELKINEAKINEEIKSQPSYFAFIAMLTVKLKKVVDDKKATLEKVEAQLFTEFKEDIDPKTNRVYSNDVAEALVVQEDDYQKALAEYNQANLDYNTLSVCTNAFEQRASLIQSLSANVRKEISIT